VANACVLNSVSIARTYDRAQVERQRQSCPDRKPKRGPGGKMKMHVVENVPMHALV
jgi:hypothetical protein